MLRPFPARLVVPERARAVVAPAYDGLTARQRSRLLALHPDSYLGVTRSPEDHPGRSDDQLISDGRAHLEHLLATGSYDDPRPALLLYELTSGDGHRQVGLVGELDVAALHDGRVLRHEATRSDRVGILARHLREVRAWSSPIAMTYRADPLVDEWVARRTGQPPDRELLDHHGVDQRVWVVRDGEITELLDTFRRQVLYVTDGHHRLDAAVEAGLDGVLVVLFPHDQMRIRAFHRAVTPPADGARVLDALAGTALSDGEDPCPRGPGETGIVVGGRWFRARLPELPARTIVDHLDVARLQDGVLAPLLGVEDPRTDPRLVHLPSAVGVEGVAEAADGGVGFLLHPMPLHDLLAVSDAGASMPPKSTSFEPKARSGLILRLLDD